MSLNLFIVRPNGMYFKCNLTKLSKGRGSLQAARVRVSSCRGGEHFIQMIF